MLSARALRIATLVAQPSLLALVVALRGDTAHLHTAASVLVALWVMMVGALAMRVIEARRAAAADRATERASPWAHLDILTASGGSMMGMGAAALVAAGLTGWASLSVVGVLGLGLVYLTATWTAIVAGGDEPWAGARVTRAIVPALAIEGDPWREAVQLSGIKIPAGMRLFASGRPTPHGAVTRYVVDSEGSRAEIVLESELGPAVRGEHRAPPLALWLGDVLGLTRTPVVHRGAATFAALPRPVAVDGARALLGGGGDDATSRPTHQLPTEGSFRMREYVPGDDTRRIHWVRSLQANQLVVRLPDEIPPAEPMVRLILDNELSGTDALSSRAPADLLDALVRVWLGIGKALTESGVRVTLVTAADKAGSLAVVERPMVARSREGLRLGARVAWQAVVPLATLVSKAAHAPRQLVVSCRPRRIAASPDLQWVVVPEFAWTSPEPALPTKTPLTLPFPSGAADNRLGRRGRERRRIETMWRDRAVFTQVMCWVDWSQVSASYVARPNRQGRIALTAVTR